MATLPDPTDAASLVVWIILALLAVIGVLAGAIRYLFQYIMRQQAQVEGLLGETKAVMGSVAELVRSTNELLVEVKDTINKCRKVDG